MQNVSLTNELVPKKHVLAALRLYVTKTLIGLPAIPADQLLKGAGQADISSDAGLTHVSYFAFSCL